MLVVSVVVLLVRYRLAVIIRRKEKEHDTQIKFMRSEYKALNALMNPHFIFNTINNLQTLFNNDDKRRANKYLKIFSDLVRQNMHNVSKDLISLQKEMDLVANYLMLEKLRFEHLNCTISVDEDLDLSDIMVPPMLIQPLVENSIKHGILPLMSTDGHVYITVSEIGKRLRIEIKDNGIGVTQNISQRSDINTHESFGLANIRERIRQLGSIQDNDLAFDMNEIKDETTGQ
jgi:LytS/YehU family sensor histidine kinase